METRSYLLHALSPLHAGTGQAADVIDLPIARMSSTRIPIVPGSSVKGVLRDARAGIEELAAVFGPDAANSADHAGALMVGDARLLALPVRSYRGTFGWTTSPLLLALAARDLAEAGREGLPAIPNVEKTAAKCAADSLLVYEGRLYLQDLDLEVVQDAAVLAWAAYLEPFVGSDLKFGSRFVVVDDETMALLCETGTQVDTRVRLDPGTRTVARGALWVEESLPPETLLIGLMTADRSRRKDRPMEPKAVLEAALPSAQILQFGGKATVGRGRCRILPV